MDKWHHIVFSRASGTHKYFLDGEIVYNTALSINFDGSDQSLVVGRFYSDNSGYNFHYSDPDNHLGFNASIDMIIKEQIVPTYERRKFVY